jgi:hypothetical protein
LILPQNPPAQSLCISRASRAGPLSNFRVYHSGSVEFDSMVKRIKNAKQCAYCGAEGNLTVDHIPPKCLLPDPLPSDLITVPCCETCRDGTANDDTYFQAALAMRSGLYQHPDVQKILPKIVKSFGRPEQIIFTEYFFNQVKLVQVQTASESVQHPVATIDLNRIRAVLSRITMGLYFHEVGKRLPDECQTWVITNDEYSNMSSEAKKIIGKVVSTAEIASRRTSGETAFGYKFSFAEDNNFCSIWILTFYESLSFVTATFPTQLYPTE